MILLICALLVLGAIAALFFIPLLVRIDTFNSICSATWGPVRVAFLERADHLRLRVDAPFLHREFGIDELIDMSKARGRSDKGSPGSEKKRSQQRRWAVSGRMLLRIIRSFKVRQFRWHLNTGDPSLNAWLFPVFHLWRMRGHDVRISFTGDHGMLLESHNNAFRLIKAVLFTPTNQSKPKNNEQGHQ